MQSRHSGLSRPRTTRLALVVLLLLGAGMAFARSVTAQIRQVSGVLGLRYDRLGGGGQAGEGQLLGQFKLQAFGFVRDPSLATFFVMGESRRGVVTTPSGYGLLNLGRPTTVTQAQARIDVAPGRLFSSSLDLAVARTAQDGISGAALQQSGGVRLAFRGTPSLPAVGVAYRLGTSRFTGGGASPGTYRQASVDLSKSGERSSMADGLRMDWAPSATDLPGRRSTNADVTGTTDLSDALRFSVSASYADLVALARPTRTGGVRATLNYVGSAGAVATLSATSDFTSAFGLWTQSQQVRIDGTRPVSRRVRAGGSAVVRRVGVEFPVGGLSQRLGFSGAALAEADLPFRDRLAQVVGSLGFSAEGRSSDTEAPRRGLDYRLQAMVPAVALDWLALTSGASVSGQRLAGGGGGSVSYSVSQQVECWVRPVRWSATAAFSRQQLSTIVTAAEPAAAAAIAVAGGAANHLTLATNLTVQPLTAVTLTGSANYDAQTAPRRSSVLTGAGRLAWRSSGGTELAAEGQVYRFSTSSGTDFVNLGLVLTRQFRQLEFRSELRVSRALRDPAPARTYLAVYVTRAFSASFR